MREVALGILRAFDLATQGSVSRRSLLEVVCLLFWVGRSAWLDLPFLVSKLREQSCVNMLESSQVC